MVHVSSVKSSVLFLCSWVLVNVPRAQAHGAAHRPQEADRGAMPQSFPLFLFLMMFAHLLYIVGVMVSMLASIEATHGFELCSSETKTINLYLLILY